MRAALALLLGLAPAVVLGGVVPGLGVSASTASTSRAWDEGPWRPAWVLAVANLTVRVPYESGESDETLASRACSMSSLKAASWASVEPTSEASCVGAVRNALLVARRPRVGYWRQLSTGTWVPIDLLKGEGSWDGANRACANAMGEAPPDCVDVVYDEIRRLRGGAWRTRPPASVRPTDARFWRAVEHLENELQARGLLVYDGHTANSAFKIELILDVARSLATARRVCEVGFNAGHSALGWLTGHAHAHVVSFDLATNGYAETAALILDEMFPGRMTLVVGDSATSVAEWAQAQRDQGLDPSCDILFIDGAHTFEPVLSDLVSFERLASFRDAGHVLLMDDFGCAENHCRGVREAWYAMQLEGRVAEMRLVLGDESTFLVTGQAGDRRTNGILLGWFTSPAQRRERARGSVDALVEEYVFRTNRSEILFPRPTTTDVNTGRV